MTVDELSLALYNRKETVDVASDVADSELAAAGRNSRDRVLELRERCRDILRPSVEPLSEIVNETTDIYILVTTDHVLIPIEVS